MAGFHPSTPFDSEATSLTGPNRREKILAAAEAVFSEKGFSQGTISEIARKAGLAESVIYRYFKGKEHILFSVPEKRLEEALALLDRDLQGIRDPESRLRKMMWGHLWYNDVRPGYARILLFECRSSPAFYTTPAYNLIKSYAARLTAILEDGMKEGKFRSDVDQKIMRDIILGTLDMEGISLLGMEEIDSCQSSFDDVADLILAMLSPRQCLQKGQADKPNQILDAAEKMFAEKGYLRAKISEIAKMAGVADGTVYEYFKSKDDLLLAIPARRFSQYLESVSGAFEITDPLRKLRRMIKYHFSTFLTDRDFLKVFNLRILLTKDFYRSKAFDAFRNYYRYVEDIIEEGKSGGVFRQVVRARVFRNMFLGAFGHMVLRWMFIDKPGETDMMQEINDVTDLLLDAVLTHRGL